MQKKHIVLLVIICLIFFMFIDFKINGVWVFESYFRQMETDSLRELQRGGKSLTYRYDSNLKTEMEGELLVNPQSAAELYLNNDMGSVKVKGEDREDIKVNFKITVYAGSVAEAEEFIKKLGIENTVDSKQVRLYPKKVQIPENIDAVVFDYDIRVPEELALDIGNRYGELTASYINNNVKLNGSYGSVTANDIGGTAEVSSRYGSLYLAAVEKLSDVDISYGKADIRDLSGDLLLESRYTAVEIDGIEGQGDIDIDYGGLRYSGIGGNITLKTRYAGISGSRSSGALSADIRYGDIDLKDIESDLKIDSEYADITVYISPEVEDYQLDCSTRYNRIHTNLPFEVRDEGDNFEALSGEQGSGTTIIEINNRHGDIALYQR